MPKVIQSPVSEWPGTVTLHEPMTLVHEAAWEDALSHYERGRGAAASALALLPGVFACVQSWDLSGFPVKPTLESFPTRPREARTRLIAWLVSEISELYTDGEIVPNG